MSQQELQKFLSKCFRQRVLEALQVLQKGLIRHGEITKELEKMEKNRKIEVLRSMESSMNNITIISEPNTPIIRIKIVGEEKKKIIKKLDADCIGLEPQSREHSEYKVKLTMNPQRASEMLEWLLANRLAIKFGEGAFDDKRALYTVSPFFKDIYEDLLDLVQTFEKKFQRIQNKINALRILPETIKDFDEGIKYFLAYYTGRDLGSIEVKHNILEETIDINIYITCNNTDMDIYKKIIKNLIGNICQEPTINILQEETKICGFAITGKIRRKEKL